MYIFLISSWLKILKKKKTPFHLLSQVDSGNSNVFDESFHVPHTTSQHPAPIVAVYPKSYPAFLSLPLL